MHNNFLKTLIFSLSACLVLPTMARAAEIPQSIRDAGKLTLMINATFPPMEFVDPEANRFIGLDIELVDAIAERLNLKVERSDGSFGALIPALTTGRTDFILSGMLDNEERRQSMDFINYMKAGAQFYVLVDSPIKEPIELCGKTVGTIRSANYYQLAEDWSRDHCVAAGLEPIKMIGAEGSPDVRLQLRQERIDAGVQGGESVMYTSAQEGGSYRLIGEPLITAYYGAAFRKGESEFRDAIADVFDELIKDGTYHAIFEKWGLSSHALPQIMINGKVREP